MSADTPKITPTSNPRPIVDLYFAGPTTLEFPAGSDSGFFQWSFRERGESIPWSASAKRVATGTFVRSLLARWQLGYLP